METKLRFFVALLTAEFGTLGLLLAQGKPHFVSSSLGWEAIGEPWITDVLATDLDQDGMMDVVVCDGRLNKVSWIRQEQAGVFIERDIGELIPGPVHAEVADLDADGDLDVLVSSMGSVVPNNSPIGSVVALENQGDGTFENRILLEHVPRVTFVEAGDLDGDGDLDLSVGLFGFVEGQIRWLENVGLWRFESHQLLDYSGTIHAPIGDVDGDGDMDIVALVSQDWEEVYLFKNDGKGNFETRVIYGSLNENFGSSGIDLMDIDGDGDLDVAYTNGDGLDYATPGPRSWHGLQWLENEGSGSFEYRRVGDLPGAHSPLVTDCDGDGDQDIFIVSGFNDWTNPRSASLVCYLQVESGVFEEHLLANKPTHLVTIDAADFDGDGDLEIVTGGFHYYPPFSEMSRVTFWDQKKESDE